jgi:hypothetical protein
MTTPKIGLRICGTKERRGGFQPLVAVGVLADGEAGNMDRVPSIAEKPAYVLKHASDHTLYMLIDRGVKSFDADAPGVLTIALTIPGDFQLAYMKSPYTLLQEIYETFKSNYMTRLSDGRDSFMDKDAESGIFRQIIDRYSLVPRPCPLIPMAPQCPTGILRVPKEKLEGFFRDTNYDEFKQFSDIEVGTECVCSPGLENLDIPKLPMYELWFNGQKTGRFYRQKPGEDTLTIEKKGFQPINITLQALMEAPNQRIVLDDITVELDMMRTRILFNTQQSVPPRLAFKWRFDNENAKSEATSMISNGRLKIKLGQNDVSRFAVSGEQVELGDINIYNTAVTISLEHTSKYDFNVSKHVIEKNNQRLLLIKIKVTTKSADAVHSPEEKTEGGDIPEGRHFSKKAIAITLCGLLLGLGGIFAIYKMLSQPDDVVAKNEPKNPPAVMADAGKVNPSDSANQEQKQEDSIASPAVTDSASNNTAQNAEQPKTKEKTKKNDGGGTYGGGTYDGGAYDNIYGGSSSGRGASGSSMSKTDAIGVLLSRQGNMDAARKALLPQEINDIEVVGALNNKSDEANQIISQLKSGDITPAEAKKRMQELDKSGGGNFGYGDSGNVGGGPMTKTIAIRILLGERLGKPEDAEKLLGADAKTVRNIRSTYSKLPEARKEKAAPIIEQLKSGALTPAAALQKLSNIING